MTTFKKATLWIEENWTNNEKKCEVCSNNNWIIDSEITAIPRAMFDKEVFPVFLCACSQCGNTKMFSAKLAGIVEK